MDPVVVIAVIAVIAVAVIILILATLVKSRRDASGSISDHRASDQPPPGGPPPKATTATTDRRLRDRLTRSRSALASSLGGFFSSGGIDADEWQDLEDALVLADVGPTTAARVVAAVRSQNPATGLDARGALEDELIAVLDRTDRALIVGAPPSVIVVVGVNGTGKTTSIAKIAKRLVDEGQSVVLGAADTFRAAADTQLRTWGDRVGVPVVSGADGSDPASVAFDALQKATATGADVVIIDTAGRLHSQTNLMDELRKVVRVLEREAGSIDEVLLVLDGAVGQNGIAQAKSFTEAVGVTGVVLTKLDGTARGGVAIAIEHDLDVPVKLIGVGEGMDDLIPFVPEDFVRALVDE
jgi:fused signal recognition particle receptor